MAAIRKAVTMLTFAPTLDSEQARLLLHYHSVPYREVDRLVPWVAIRSKLSGGGGEVPLVKGHGFAVAGPRPIAEHYDAAVPPDYRLIPAEPARAAQFEADWALTNGTMSGGTAVYAYYHLLPEQKLMAPIFAAPTALPGRLAMPLFYPLMRKLIASRLELTPERAEAAKAKILTSFDAVDARVADGRLYLEGERMTLADIALAAAAAPLLLPKGYGTQMPPLERMPPPMAELMRSLADRPTAHFVRRFYAEGLPAARNRLAAASAG